MKSFIILTTTLLAGLGSLSALAASPVNSSTFNVTVNLTAECTLSAPGNVTINYDDGVGVTSTTASSLNVKCTNQLPYSVALLTGAAAAVTFPVTDSVVGIAYTLTLGAPVGGSTGTGANQSYTITPSATAAQTGTCAAPTAGVCTNTGATNNTYLVQVTY